jgi:hypothetical protein
MLSNLLANRKLHFILVHTHQKRFPPRLIGCRGAAPLLVPPEDVPVAMRGLLSDSLSSSLEDDVLGFGLLVGRRGDDSEPEDGSIFIFVTGAGGGLASLFKEGVSSILLSSFFNGSVELEMGDFIFLSTGSSASDSVAESGSTGFT